MNELLPQNRDKKGRLDLSVIIVSWNSKEFLRQCLQSVYKTTRKVKVEVWVIDNGSSDGSQEMVRNEFPNVKLVCSSSNLGFAKANNIGIKKSTARYLSLVNPDIKILNGCMDRLFAYMDKNPIVGIVGPRILNLDMSLQMSAYGFPNIWNSLCNALGLDKFFPKLKLFRGPYKKYWPYDKVLSVDVVSGCFWMVRREAFSQVGLLDEDFFMYREDFDLCKRFRKKGWDVVYFPEAQAIHYGGGSSSNAPVKCVIEGHKSFILYARKHHGELGKLYIILLIFIRQSLRIIQDTICCVIKPSKRVTFVQKIKQNIAGIQWLVTNHGLK